MPSNSLSERRAIGEGNGRLSGHARRNANLRLRSLERARSAPPLAQALVQIRAETLGMTRLDFARQSGISRGTLRDIELGVHWPTRRTLHQFVAFCEQRGVGAGQLERLLQLYSGEGITLEERITRLELLAGSPAELARRVEISPTTLWEYKRGNFPLPLALLIRLHEAVDEDASSAEFLWHQAQRERLLKRGYPEALAEFWVLCFRAGHSEKDLLSLGLTMATIRRLRYLELPAWKHVVPAANRLCHSEEEKQTLKQLWQGDEQKQRKQGSAGFGMRLLHLREHKGIPRRMLADLFDIGGKKPARIIKAIEEGAFYSAQAYPAGLAALVTDDENEQTYLLELWQQRRRQFHARHRPEMRIELRLCRELYGFGLDDMEPILGYPSLEYQRIERGITPLRSTAQARILEALTRAGKQRVADLLVRRQTTLHQQLAWQVPDSVQSMISLLAGSVGGYIPLARKLKKAGLRGVWAGRLRAIVQGHELPSWYLLEQISQASQVRDTTLVYADWQARSRRQWQVQGISPLGVEIRLLLAEVAPNPTTFSKRLSFNKSVLIRDLQRIDRGKPLRWFHIERLLQAASVHEDSPRWKAVHAWWYSANTRV